MTNTISMEKYVDPGIPRVNTIINNIHIPNTLIDLGAAINVMTLETMKTLQLTNLQHTTIVLELVDRSKVIPEGILEDIIVSLDSWEYPVEFLVLQPKSNLGGHPIILRRPWLATVDAFIGCRSGNMIISRGTERKQLTLYPSAQSPVVAHNLWLDDKYNDKNCSSLDVSEELRNDQYHAADELLAQNFQETCTINSLQTTFHNIFPIQSITNTQSKTIEISPGKTLNIGTHLDSSQEEKLIQLLRKYQKEFTWGYTDMHEIHPETCTHHIYIDSNVKPVRQPQRRMNPMLQDVVREELQKLLRVNFIYPISDSQWVSPLVVVPKKNGKWRICVDYRQLNKATLKDYFPLPFIDQVLDTLAGKSSFSFLDGFSGYNQIRIALEDQDKTTFTFPWATYAYNVLTFGLYNSPATFQRVVLDIFADLVHDCVEVYMDDFSVYGDSFEHALMNLEKVLKRCIEANLSLSNEKCFIMLNEGIVLGHYISSHGIKVDPSKIQISVDLPIPKTQKEQAFETLKAKLSTTPVLKGPNWSLPFHIFTYASNTAVGASLGQKEQSCHYVIYFISKNLTPEELNYTVTEKEMLGVIHVVNKFGHYITGYEVFVHTDHSTIKHLMNKPVTSGRVTRWLLLLQEFNITVLDRPGKENQVADFLSRLQNLGEAVPVEDSFPDENLFAISIVNPWYDDLVNYLSTRRTPPSFTPKEKKRLIKQSARYSWVNGDLFYTGYDMIIRRCVRNDEIIDILKSFDDEPCGGDFAAKRTTFKILNLGYY
eukprot:PITA_20812